MEKIKNIDIDGYTVDIYHEYDGDGDADTSFLGEFSDKWETGAFDRRKTGDYERGQFQYFIPSPGCETYAEAKKRGKKNLTEWVHQAKYAHVRVEKIARGDISYIGVIAKAFKNGVLLGEGSLWGVESDSGSKYLDDVANECTFWAVEEAKAKLCELVRD